MEKLSDKAKLYIRTYEQSPYVQEIDGIVELLKEMSEKLEEYEDLEEQGKLPCAMGIPYYAETVVSEETGKRRNL